MAAFVAKPNWLICTSGFPVPAGRAGLLSAFVYKVQVKLEIVPIKVKHLVPKKDTWISAIVKPRLVGSVTARV